MATVDVVRDAPRAQLALEDASVVIPASVRAAAARANAFYDPATSAAALATAQQFDREDPTKLVSGGTLEAGTAPPPSPINLTQTPVAPVAAPPAATPVAPVAPPVPVMAQAYPASTVPETAAPGQDSWQTRFLAMQGRFNQSQGILSEMQSQLTQMSNELMATRHAAQQRIAEPPSQPQRLITDQEVKDYGPEFIDVVSRAAREQLLPVVDGLKGELDSLRSANIQQAKRDVHTLLDSQIPNWREVNRSQNFLNWLALREPYSGVIRKVLLTDAFNAADGARVLAVFKGFLADEAAVRPAAPATGVPAAQSAPRTAPVNLEVLAAPGRAQSSPTTDVAGGKPVYTTAQIREFYARKTRGAYFGREVEADAIERDIFAAQHEGRVRG